MKKTLVLLSVMSLTSLGLASNYLIDVGSYYKKMVSAGFEPNVGFVSGDIITLEWVKGKQSISAALYNVQGELEVYSSATLR